MELINRGAEPDLATVRLDARKAFQIMISGGVAVLPLSVSYAIFANTAHGVDLFNRQTLSLNCTRFANSHRACGRVQLTNDNFRVSNGEFGSVNSSGGRWSSKAQTWQGNRGCCSKTFQYSTA